ncbi:MAG: ATP synthase F1 subunit delta [Elusimicrobia bacterium RIFCSPLOWO2_01_FULL_60_11]|nr:MAG: ATP synthase F1 subunit delta [Elusimicrobia bacterium RIFCSPLOWO2_01_FULL_60_11]
MKETAVAERYARALFLAAAERKGIDLQAVMLGLEDIARKLGSDAKGKSDLESPIVPLSEKKHFIRKGLKVTEPLLLNLLDLLAAKKRTGLIPLILSRFHETVEESRGRVRALVKSAAALDAAARKEMEKRLSALFKKDVFIEASVDPSLLAGVVIQAGDTVIDGSLRNRLKNLRSILTSND